MSQTPSARIRDEFRREILSGRLAPGVRLPTERQLAARYGVASTTINKAMTLLERDGLLERRRGLGTYVRPDLGRRALAVVLGPPGAPPGAEFWADLARRVLESAAGRDGGVRTYLAAGTADLGDTPLAADARAGRLAGALLLGAGGAPAAILEDAGIPFVDLAGYGPGPAVRVAWREATRALTAEMLGRGARPLAVQLRPGRPGDEMLAGYREALAAAGAAADEALIGRADAADGPAGRRWAGETAARGTRGFLLGGERPEAALAAIAEVSAASPGRIRPGEVFGIVRQGEIFAGASTSTSPAGASQLSVAVWCVAGRTPGSGRSLARLETDLAEIVQAGYEMLAALERAGKESGGAGVAAGHVRTVVPRFIEGETLPPAH